MTTSVPPYARVASVASTLFRIVSYILLRIIPGRIAPPLTALFYTIYLLAYWLGSRQVPALDKAKLEAAKGKEPNGHPVQAIPEHRAIDNAPGTTFLLTLPTSSRTLRRMSFVANAVIMFMAAEFVTKPHFAPAEDLAFARVGAVDSTSAKIVVRYPAAPEPTTTASLAPTSTPLQTSSVIEAVQEAVDGALPEITLPPNVEEAFTPVATPPTTSLRIQWRKLGFDSGSLDSLWTDGPVVEMLESRDWVGMAKLTGLQAGAEYEYRLIELDGKTWSSHPDSLTFRTTPDSRLARGSHFRFVSTSCVIPNFPYNPFASGVRIKGFDLLAEHIWPTHPEVKDTPTKAEDEVDAAPPMAEESPEAVAALVESTEGLTSASSESNSATPLPTDDSQAHIASTEIPPTAPVKPTPAIEFLMMMGDFIYADVPYYFGDTVQAYRRLYRRVYASKSFRKIYERLPVYNIYDDHEFTNNFGANGDDLMAPYPNASNAYDIYNGQANPDPKADGVHYYDFRHGDTAFFVMDTRRYRSPPPAQKPYPYPLSLFTPVIEAIAEGKNPLAAYFNPPLESELAVEPLDESARTMLGEAQLAALHTWIADVNRTATWKFVVSSVPLTAMWGGYDGKVDLWAGYMQERDTVLKLLGSIPNVIVLSGDRHEFAAVEFPRGKYVVREFSTSPLSQFYVPFIHTLDPKNARTLSVTRTNVTVTETGEEHVDEYIEEVPEENLLKYVPKGNHKWTTIEVDSTDARAPRLKVELFVDGKMEWDHEIAGEPVELTFPSTMVIASQVQGVMGALKHTLKGWFRSH